MLHLAGREEIEGDRHDYGHGGPAEPHKSRPFPIRPDCLGVEPVIAGRNSKGNCLINNGKSQF